MTFQPSNYIADQLSTVSTLNLQALTVGNPPILVSPASVASTGSLPNAISGAVAMIKLPNGQVLSCGGAPDSSGFNSSVECRLYDPIAGTWSLTGNMAAGRAWNINAVVGGAQGHRLVILTTGSDAGNALIVGGDGGTVEIYNVSAGTWSTTTTIGGGNSGDIHAVLLNDGRVLAWSMNSATPRIFDPVAHTWSNAGSVGFGFSGHAQLTLLSDGRVLFTGGVQFGSDTTPGKIYDPNANSWSNAGNQVHGKRQFAAAVRMANGKVLICGGNVSGSGTTATAEIYDPVANTFTATTHTMTHARQYHIALPLPDGKIWIYGGINDNSSEIFNPADQTFTADLSTTDNGWWRPGVFLDNGKVLLAGQSGGGGSPQTSAELYTPAVYLGGGVSYSDLLGSTVTLIAPSVLSASYSVSLPPSQGAANATLVNDGLGNLSWTIVGAAAGSDTQIQFNQSGAFGASANLFWDYTLNKLDVEGDMQFNGNINVPNYHTINCNDPDFGSNTNIGNGNLTLTQYARGASQSNPAFTIQDTGTGATGQTSVGPGLQITTVVQDGGGSPGASAWKGGDLTLTNGQVLSGTDLGGGNIVLTGFNPALGGNIYLTGVSGNQGQIGVGTTTPNTSASIDITSTVRGFLPPRMNTSQKTSISSPATGLVVYDTTLNKLCVFTGSVWETVTSA